MKKSFVILCALLLSISGFSKTFEIEISGQFSTSDQDYCNYQGAEFSFILSGDTEQAADRTFNSNGGYFSEYSNIEGRLEIWNRPNAAANISTSGLLGILLRNYPVSNVNVDDFAIQQRIDLKPLGGNNPISEFFNPGIIQLGGEFFEDDSLVDLQWIEDFEGSNTLSSSGFSIGCIIQEVFKEAEYTAVDLNIEVRILPPDEVPAFSSRFIMMLLIGLVGLFSFSYGRKRLLFN